MISELDEESFTINIGPNPSTDFIEVRSDKVLRSDMQILLRDLSGRIARVESLVSGSSQYLIDVSKLPPTSYHLELKTLAGQTLASEKIVVAQ